MKLYDVMFRLDEDGRFQDLWWGNRETQNLCHLLFESWTARHRRMSSVFQLPEGKKSGRFYWDEEAYLFLLLDGPEKTVYLLLKKESHREYLFARALDRVTDGVQIYDKNACAVYFNQASRKISHIPSGVDPGGRHLLDLYNLDEEISTTMTALRTRSPVINRVDRFKAGDDTTIATANTSYPIVRDGELLGAVVFEQTEEIAQADIRRMDEVQKALRAYASHSTQISFSGYTFENVIGQSEKMRSAVNIARKVAPQDSSILLVGETGTGKEIFAQSIHRASSRRGKKFLAINCAAIPETLIESLLFGTQKGSFTGSEDKAGYFEEASGGTLFLDELNSMSLNMQSKILRVIQENTFRRVGGSRDLKLDVRIISSCNEDPFTAIANNRFRRDLFYRLSTVMIDLPPLREHLEDLEDLVRYHLGATAYQYVHAISSVDPQVYRIFRAYDWPGNVRELFHVLDYAQNVADSTTMLPEHLPPYLLKKQTGAAPQPSEHIDFSNQTLQGLLDEYERTIILQALEHCGYNLTRTARTLGILRQSLQYRIRKYGIVF